MIAPPVPPDGEFIFTHSDVLRRMLSYNIKMPFSSVAVAEITGQLCYIIVKPAGTPLIEEALSFPVSVSKLGSRAGSLSSAALSTLLDFFKSASMGSANAIFISPRVEQELSHLNSIVPRPNLHNHILAAVK